MEDQKLIEAVLSGDVGAFNPLMDRYYTMVYRLCLNMSGNVPDAEELTHDSFVEAYLKLGQLREPDRFGGWLKTLALNVCRMWYRRNQQSVVELAEDQVAVVDDIEDSSIRARMSYGLHTLSTPHRLVLALHYYEELSYDEIAVFLEVPKGTVMSRLHRARQALKEVMEQMTEYEEIPAVPDDRFKEVVEAEIAVLLRMFGDEPNAPERLTLVLKKSPLRLMDLIAGADVTETLRNMAILLPHLGSEAVDTILDCRFSTDQRLASKTDELLQIYASRCGTIPQREGMTDMASREAYLILDRLIAHSADDQSKAELLLTMMEACEEACPVLLFTNALMCYEQAAFPFLMDHFLTDSKQSSRVLHALVRTGARFGSRMLELIKSDDPGMQAVGLSGCEAIARSLCPSWLNGFTREQFLNDLRTREKWPPLRVEDIGSGLITDLTRETASLVTNGPEHLRAPAVRVLGYLRAAEYSEIIQQRLSDNDLATRMAAIFALSEIGDGASADALISRAQTGEVPEKAAAIAALGRLQIGHAEHVMVEMTSDEDEQVREAAVAALGEMGTVSSQVVLQELMRGSDPRMQKAAAKAVFGGVQRKKPELSDVGRRLAEKRRKVTPVAMISPDAVLRFELTEIRTYDERDLTDRIARVCLDYCATRRYMIELGLMTRFGGVYEFTEIGKSAWRVEQFICERYLAKPAMVG
ncbi:sigma-70 family RNA polymerase sigma factor [bacterium]|nr:sigma-70 family RNA polymerase sigma factor [bacterium]